MKESRINLDNRNIESSNIEIVRDFLGDSRSIKDAGLSLQNVHASSVEHIEHLNSFKKGLKELRKKGITKHVLKNDFIATRGSSIDELLDMLKSTDNNNIFISKKPASSAAKDLSNGSFTDGARILYRFKKGMTINNMESISRYKGEYEILIDSASKLKVTSIAIVDNAVVAVVEVL